MITKKIGKIQKAECGHGGYQDAMIGFSFDLGSDKDGWGVGDFWGYWSIERSESTKWTENDRIKALGEVVMKFAELLEKAKVDSIDKLEGKPVEVIFDGQTLKNWRILEEAL